MNTKIITTSKNILILLLVLLSYALQSPAAKQQAELARYNQLGDAALLAKGKELAKNGKDKLALNCFELLQSRGDRVAPALRAESEHEAGLLFYATNNYSKAMENFMNSMDICEKLKLDSLLALVYKDIGNIYSMYGDFDQSVPLYKKTLAMARARGDRKLANKMLNNLIFAYQPKTPLKQYKQWYKQLCSYKENRDRYGYDVLLARGVIEDYSHNTAAALKRYQEASRFAASHHMRPLDVATVNGMLADAFVVMGQRDSALIYLNRNLNIAEKNDILALKVNCFRSLADLYESTDRQKALDYKQKYLLIKDSIFNMNALSEIQNALFFHEMEKNLNTINSLNKTNQDSLKTISNQKFMLLILGCCAVVFLTLLTVTWQQKRKLSAAYHNLFNKNEESILHDKVISRQLDVIDRPGREEHREQKPETTTSAMRDAEEEQSATPEAKPEETGEEIAEQTSKTTPELTIAHTSDQANEQAPRARLIPTQKQQNELLADILNVMENSDAYCDPDFGIEKLAAMTNSNSRYVSQVINDVYGMNFRALVNDFRIKKAIIRMTDTENYGNFTIRAIAESVGYKSQANFINVFTKNTGLKPSTYLKLLKEKQIAKAV